MDEIVVKGRLVSNVNESNVIERRAPVNAEAEAISRRVCNDRIGQSAGSQLNKKWRKKRGTLSKARAKIERRRSREKSNFRDTCAAIEI